MGTDFVPDTSLIGAGRGAFWTALRFCEWCSTDSDLKLTPNLVEKGARMTMYFPSDFETKSSLQCPNQLQPRITTASGGREKTLNRRICDTSFRLSSLPSTVLTVLYRQRSRRLRLQQR